MEDWCLPPIENNSEVNKPCKLPDTKQVMHPQAKKRGNLDRLACGLPSIFERKEEHDKNLKLHPVANAQGSESPRMDKEKE